MKYLLIAICLFPINLWANALLPLNNIWNREAPQWFFIAYFLILLIEILFFKAFFRQIKMGIHLKAIFVANIVSSVVGSLAINLYVGEKVYLNASYPKIFTVFFIITVFTEYPVLRYFYSKYLIKKLLLKTVVANLLTYTLLLVLQLSGFFLAFKWVEIKADRYKNEWTHQEIVPDALKILYVKNVNKGMESELLIFQNDSIETLKTFPEKMFKRSRRIMFLLVKKCLRPGENCLIGKIKSEFMMN